MAAAAARAALVAMQKKKRKKENMLKKLSSNINFDEDDRLFLLESLFDKESTKFLADLAGGTLQLLIVCFAYMCLFDLHHQFETPTLLTVLYIYRHIIINIKNLNQLCLKGEDLNPVANKVESRVMVDKRQSGLQKPYFISDKHFRHLLNRMARGKSKEHIKIWINAYFKSSFSCQFGEVTGKVAPETPTSPPTKDFDSLNFPTTLRSTSDFILRYNYFILMNQVHTRYLSLTSLAITIECC